MPRPPRNYTVAEVADILRVSPYYAQQLCRAGKIPGAHKAPESTRWLIDVKTFEAHRSASITRAAS